MRTLTLTLSLCLLPAASWSQEVPATPEPPPVEPALVAEAAPEAHAGGWEYRVLCAASSAAQARSCTDTWGADLTLDCSASDADPRLCLMQGLNELGGQGWEFMGQRGSEVPRFVDGPAGFSRGAPRSGGGVMWLRRSLTPPDTKGPFEQAAEALAQQAELFAEAKRADAAATNARAAADTIARADFTVAEVDGRGETVTLAEGVVVSVANSSRRIVRNWAAGDKVTLGSGLMVHPQRREAAQLKGE